MGFKGVDSRQSGDRIIFRASLKDSSGVKVTTGTASLYLYEIQSDGSLKSYDFSSNTFKSTALTTETASLTHRTGNNGTTNTGIWTYVLSTVSGFTRGGTYLAVVSHSSASPAQQEREFVYGDAEGDFTVNASGQPVSESVAGDVYGKLLGNTPTDIGGVGAYVLNSGGGEVAGYDQIGVAGSNLTALPDPSGVTTLLGRVTAAVATAAGQTTITTHLTDIKGTGWVTGDNLHSRLDAAVSSRMATFTLPTNFSSLGIGATGKITGVVLVDTTTDVTTKTGYSLSASQTFSTTGTVGGINGVTFPTNFSLLGISAAGKINGVVLTDTLTTYTGNTPQTGDAYARLGAPAGASVSADVAAVKTDTGNLVSRITSTLFANITSLANWLGALAGKTADTATRAEINATTAGVGYNETTDSQEALRDRGDAAWTTGAGAGGGGTTVNEDTTIVSEDTEIS